MSYADPLTHERQRCEQIERAAVARDLALRREMIRVEHRERHDRERAEYRASPIARRIRFARAKAFLRSMGTSFRASYRTGRAAGRARVMDGPVVRADRQSLGQRLRAALSRIAGRSRGGAVERERTQARERSQERQQQRTQQLARQQQQTRTTWGGPEQQKARAKTRSRSRQRCR